MGLALTAGSPLGYMLECWFWNCGFSVHDEARGSGFFCLMYCSRHDLESGLGKEFGGCGD